MRIPTIHRNGTSKAELTGQIEAALEAVRTAIDAVGMCCPNGRDYYTQGDQALREASNEHLARLTRLATVRDELAALWEGIEDQA
jgi:hypothetical protein